MATTKTAKLTRLGGPLLGNSFKPLVTVQNVEQLILLPNHEYVTVLAYKTGQRLATLVPASGCSGIKSACLAQFPPKKETLEEILDLEGDGESDSEEQDHLGAGECREASLRQILLVGCTDGTVQEFLLEDIFDTYKTRQHDCMCGAYYMSGKCVGPRRVLKLSTQPILHLSVPKKWIQDDSLVVYSIVESEKTADAKSVEQNLFRAVLQDFDESKDKVTTTPVDLKVNTLATINSRIGKRDEKGETKSSVPFQLISFVQEAEKVVSDAQTLQNDSAQLGARTWNAYVIVARYTGFQVCHEQYQVNDKGEATWTQSSSLSYPLASGMTSMALSPNGLDLACGFRKGNIRLLTNVIPILVEYFAKAKGEETAPHHPMDTVVVRKLHWHSHPVVSLSFYQAGGVNPLLYSGGEESVLVIWQLARGSSRPADTLPRIAKGGIRHIVGGSPMSSTPGILVCCEDNTVQLFEAHSRDLIWKHRGLAMNGPNTILRRDGNLLLMSNIVGASGQIQWYNTETQQMQKSMEVAPYNRVSRTEVSDSPMPQPAITHIAFCDDNSQFLTVETTATENPGVGRPITLDDGSEMGVMTTIKFWAKMSNANKRDPYFMTASMSFPHGERNRISAIAISSDGQYACTISNDDRSFRVWRQSLEVDQDDATRRRPAWVCQYKITTPSGYSNFTTTSGGVAFSSDGSTLCICYGYHITLWDHRDATLLTSLRHADDSPIKSMEFVNTDLCHDSILTKSTTAVKLQSPYGNKSKSGWSYVLPMTDTTCITHAQLINGEQILMAAFIPNERKSHILLANSVSGEIHTHVEVPFKVQSVALAGPKFKRPSGFVKQGEPRSTPEEPPIRLLVMNFNGELFLLQQGNDDVPVIGKGTGTQLAKNRKQDEVPRLYIPPSKRPRLSEEEGVLLSANEPEAFSAYLAQNESQALPSGDLPSLSGNFLRSILSRQLRRDRR